MRLTGQSGGDAVGRSLAITAGTPDRLLQPLTIRLERTS